MEKTVRFSTLNNYSVQIKSEVQSKSIPHPFRFRFCPKAQAGANGFGAEIFVLRPEGVYTYDEREETEIENEIRLKRRKP